MIQDFNLFLHFNNRVSRLTSLALMTWLENMKTKVLIYFNFRWILNSRNMKEVPPGLPYYDYDIHRLGTKLEVILHLYRCMYYVHVCRYEGEGI